VQVPASLLSVSASSKLDSRSSKTEAGRSPQPQTVTAQSVIQSRSNKPIPAAKVTFCYYASLLSRESDGICIQRRWFVCVCLTVTTITKKIVDGFVPNFMGRFLWGNGRPSSCFVTIGEGCGSNGKKNSVNRGNCLQKTAIVYKIALSGNSKLAGRKIVSVASWD